MFEDRGCEEAFMKLLSTLTRDVVENAKVVKAMQTDIDLLKE
jgi:hypothetical protein